VTSFCHDDMFILFSTMLCGDSILVMKDSVLSYEIQISWLVIIVLLTMSFSYCLDGDSKLLIGSA
jgi:hypothetical protein